MSWRRLARKYTPRPGSPLRSPGSFCVAAIYSQDEYQNHTKSCLILYFVTRLSQKAHKKALEC
nr:MAG TPA: hypothetical protein [Caudoviricetes sp.]